MRIIFTLVISLLFTVIVNGADRKADSIPAKKEICIRLSCTASDLPRTPLYVIDGLPVEFTEFQKLKVEDISSITVLKDASATALYGSRGAAGVVLIITVRVRKFVIKDIADSSIIPGASITFRSSKNSFNTATNYLGVFGTDLLQAGTEYEMIITSTGYKPLTLSFNASFIEEKEIFLEKDIHEEKEIVIVSYKNRRRGCPSHFLTKLPDSPNVAKEPKEEDIIRTIYPNPVLRNQVFNIEFKNEDNDMLRLSVIGVDGKTVMVLPQKVIKGLNRISILADSRWTAGMYLVCLTNLKGIVICKDKLVVQ